MVQYLLKEAGADINEKSKEGKFYCLNVNLDICLIIKFKIDTLVG